jgi:SAM-dependent methyltransferase
MTLEANAGKEDIRAISHRSTNETVFRLAVPHVRPGARAMDLGAGEGFFSKMIGDFVEAQYIVDPATILAACDVAPEIFRYRRIDCDRIGEDGKLPYADEAFDIVFSLEVIEHVEDQFAFCREIMRVLRPGGLAILSTPNVLNVNSRVRILHSGFATLFDPLPLSTVDAVHTSGHIHPISYYYLAYALKRAGAVSVSVVFDRLKNSARFLRALFWPIIALGNAGLRARLRRKRPQVFSENLALLRDVWSGGMLISRSIVVTARKAK